MYSPPPLYGTHVWNLFGLVIVLYTVSFSNWVSSESVRWTWLVGRLIMAQDEICFVHTLKSF